MFGIRSLAHFVARLILGFIFIMHGWQKLNTNGISATTDAFKAMGVPAPAFSAQFATWVELVGGVLLILGLMLPLVSMLLIIDMLGAIIYVHWDVGFWNVTPDYPEGASGYELPLALIAGLLAVGFTVAGAAAADSYIFSRRKKVDEYA